VEYAECYRRALPRADPAPLLAAWAQRRVHAVTVSSAEGLANLFTLLGAEGAERLRDTPLFVPHARVAEAAAARGVRAVLVSGPGDDEVLARLMAYFDAP
jgi:uroporphyrinogen-III synthase